MENNRGQNNRAPGNALVKEARETNMNIQEMHETIQKMELSVRNIKNALVIILAIMAFGCLFSLMAMGRF